MTLSIEVWIALSRETRKRQSALNKKIKSDSQREPFRKTVGEVFENTGGL
ncbi:MAG: hypothetical protein WBW33_09290 [Bryobacteraceae bacterium]